MRNFHGPRLLRSGVRKLTIALGATAVLGGLTTFGLAQAQQPAPTFSAYPQPGTLTAAEKSTISFRGGDAAALGVVTVSGSESGNHAGSLLGHSDGQGVSFVPEEPFEAGERVTVSTERSVVNATERRLHLHHRRRDHAQGAAGRVPERRARHRPVLRDAP